MPMNEAAGFHPSNLTREQQKEELAAVYGLGKRSMTPNASAEYTFDELQQMRSILSREDAKTAQAGMREFDLNKPPVPPYVFREFPMLLYHQPSGGSIVVHNSEQKERMLASGYSMDPFPPPAPPEAEAQPEAVPEPQPIAAGSTGIQLSAQEQMAAEEIDQRLKTKKR